MKELELDEILKDCWDILDAAANNRKEPMHTPVLGTVDMDGNPRQRIMVLREADKDEAYLRFHTDSRSPKTADLMHNPSASVLGYDADRKVQLRMNGIASAEPHGDMADAAWDASPAYSRRCYMIEKPPGTILEHVSTGLPEGMEGQKPSEEDTNAVRENFAIVKFTIQSIDWLFLHHQGNISARFERAPNGDWTKNWQIP